MTKLEDRRVATPQTDTGTRCVACDGSETRHYLDHPRGSYVACPGCGTVRTDPLPDAAHMKARADYWASRHNLSEQKLARAFDPSYQRLAYGKVLGKLAGFCAGDQRLLEVGCAGGGFLDTAQRRGWRTTGIELSAESVRYARDHHDLDVHQGTMETVDLGDRQFEAAVMLDVIEHVVDPLSLLRGIFHRLRPGGVLITMTPNVRGLGARWLGGRWEAYDPIDHLWMFGPKNLRLVCERAGFQVTDHWCIDLNPLAMLDRFKRTEAADSAVAETAQHGCATQPRVAAPTARRNRLIQRLRHSTTLQLGRGLVNAGLSWLDLGDKLYLRAVKPVQNAAEVQNAPEEKCTLAQR